MKNRTLRILFLSIFIYIIMIFSSNKVMGYGIYGDPSYDPSKNYTFRTGNYYFETYSEMMNYQYLFSTNAVIEVLQEEVVINDTPTQSFWIDNVEFTTCSELKNQGKVAKLVRGEDFSSTEALITYNQSGGTLTLQDIILDGGWKSDKSGITCAAPLVSMNDTGTTTLYTQNLTLQNNCNTLIGENMQTKCAGGIFAYDANIVANTNTVIQNCSAYYGGGITSSSTKSNLTANGLKIHDCYSTSATERNASAIEFGFYAGKFTCKDLTVTNCSAINATSGGQAIDAEIGEVEFVSGGTISIENNYSAGTVAGVKQSWDSYPNHTVTINFNTDGVVIDSNYVGCKFNGYELVTQGTNQCNFYINEPETVNINNDLTSAASIGVTLMHREPSSSSDTAPTGELLFANIEEGIKGLENFYKDNTDDVLGVEYSSDNTKATFGNGSNDDPGTDTPGGDTPGGDTPGGEDPVDPEGDPTICKLTLVNHDENPDSVTKYTYKVTYINGDTWNTYTKNVSLGRDGKYSFYINKDSAFKVEILSSTENLINYGIENPEIFGEFKQFGEANLNDSDHSVSGRIGTEGEVIVQYTQSTPPQEAPATGIEDNLVEIISFSIITGLAYYLINKNKIQE